MTELCVNDELAHAIAVGIMRQPNALSLTWFEALACGRDIASRWDIGPLIERHPYTCGVCSWGRDGAYHTEEEYLWHMADIHLRRSPRLRRCDPYLRCDASAGPCYCARNPKWTAPGEAAP